MNNKDKIKKKGCRFCTEEKLLQTFSNKGNCNVENIIKLSLALTP